MNQDPTENVKQMLKEAVLRLDHLREAETRRVNEQMQIRAESVTNERAIAQAALLAAQAAASTVAQQLAQISSQFNDRLVVLEKSQYESKGSSGGMRDVWGWIVGLIATLIAIGSFVLPRLK